ncbi:MAG TPA: hypothetical protein VGT07_11255, partial [Steroidobacteraceae bacterium]|nr:hypothetical protein [Steroidobacteraceae bacterium]
AGARVPEKFRAVQWLRAPDGHPTAALEALCRRLASGGSPVPVSSEPQRTIHGPPALPQRTMHAPPALPPAKRRRAPPPEFPPFPREEPGQRVRFWFQVAGWMFQWAWAAFQRLPRWVRILVYVWAGIFLLSRLTPPDRPDHSDDRPPPKISATQAEKLRELSGTGTPVGSWTAADTARLIAQIAKEVPGEAGNDSSTKAAVLAIPFAAPTTDPAAQKLASSVFTQMYGRLAIARPGRVGVGSPAQPLATLDAPAALAQGRAHDSTYIVYGAVAGSGSDERLTVKVIEVDDGSVAWSKSYPVTGADPAGIAEEVSANVPRDEDD